MRVLREQCESGFRRPVADSRRVQVDAGTWLCVFRVEVRPGDVIGFPSLLP